ncbi:MAG: hypothetical protein NTZ31_05305 [Actinobacteria bacterium]|jgi:hypothetical protein|nr:hypothetical protein [Actinomycetota bacterium]
MGMIFSAITNLHVITLGMKAVGRIVKMVAGSNFGLIGLDRAMSWFGIG